MPVTLAELRTRKQLGDRVFRGATLVGGAVILLVLGLIAYTVTSKSTLAFQTEGFGFFTEKRWAPSAAEPVFGALSFIFGTAVTATIAIVLSVPISLGLALFTTQVAPNWLKRPLVALTDIVAVVPSVVFGLWGIIFLAPKLVGFYQNLHDLFGGIPVLGSLFGKASAGRTFMTAGLILAVMITPIITSIAREVINTTPPADRDGALALGATRWEMIKGAVLPHSVGGIVGAVMLGLGRAMGETIAAALVIGSSATITSNLFSPGDSLPSVIAFQWGEATSDEKRSALIAMGLTLFVLTLLVNFAATFVVNRGVAQIAGHSMTAVTFDSLSGAGGRDELLADLAGVSGRRRAKNIVMTALMGLSCLIILTVLIFLLVTVVSKGWSIVTSNFPKWFSEDIVKSPRRPGPGMKAAIIGTVVTTGVATVIAVPLGIAGAVYLNEYGKRNIFARILRFFTSVMAGVPSIVMGLFIYVFWVVPRGTDGLTGLSGAFALACLMLPIVVRSTEEMLKLVPQNLRDACYVLGGTSSRTTLAVVIPKAAPGIISGCLLAVARAAGETAPLIFTIGASKVTNWNPFKGTNTSLSLQIYGNAKESFATAQQRAWGAALTLISLAVVFTLVARILSARISKNN